ncbi:MAG: T9SS type A sorting domain-containing protein [Crocinitomicaceae bacterium]
MKTLFTIILTTILALISHGQATHLLEATDHYFSPDTLYVQVGDTIQLVNNGYHSITEVDSIDWVNNAANYNGGFYVGFGAPTTSEKFTIDSPGTYYNLCIPHATMGMKSIIIVEAGTASIAEENSKKASLMFPNPASNSITIENSLNVKIYNMQGQLVYVKSNLILSETIDISFFPVGIYCVMLDGKQELLIVQ